MEGEQLTRAFEERSEWFTAFMGATTQKLVTVGYVLQTLGQEYTPTLRRLQGKDAATNIVGGGSGEAELQIIKGLKQFGVGNINIYYEDPSKEMHHMFRSHAESIGLEGQLKGCSSLPLESAGYKAPKNDLTFGFHMLYYVKGWENPLNPENPLKKINDSLSPEGLALVTLQSKESDNYVFRDKFLPKVHGSQANGAYGEQITEVLDQLAIPYNHEVVPSCTFIDDCFSGPNGSFDPNPNGKNLLSFLLRKEWGMVEAPLQREIADYLTQKAATIGHRKAMVFRDSYVWIPGKSYQPKI